jgi:hypothetical protein
MKSTCSRALHGICVHGRPACATAQWINRVNKYTVNKALAKARALAVSEKVTGHAAHQNTAHIGKRITVVPQVQPPQELFNSAMKKVRQTKPRADMRSEKDAARNLVCYTC